MELVKNQIYVEMLAAHFIFRSAWGLLSYSGMLGM